MRIIKSSIFAVLLLSILTLAASPLIAKAQKTIDVTLTDSSMIPNKLTVKKGHSVTLHIVNKGQKPHNLVIKDFFIFTQNLNPGETADWSFTPDKTGSFPYYSVTGGRPEPGLRGTLTVIP